MGVGRLVFASHGSELDAESLKYPRTLLQPGIPSRSRPHLVLLCTQSAIPLMDNIMPIIVSDALLAQCSSWPMRDSLTSTDNLLFDPPLANNCEQKCKCVGNGHRQAQLCHHTSASYSHPRTIRQAVHTSLANQQEEPHTPRQVNNKGYRISRVPE